MKKIILILIIMMFPTIINAACSYSDIVDLNTLASYVDKTFDVDSNNKFSLTLTNITEELFLKYNNQNYNRDKNGIVIVKNIEEGTNMTIGVYSTDKTNCYDTYLRNIYINTPYINEYYNHELCKNYMNYTICNSKFLSYKVTYSIFQKSLEEIKQNENKKNVQTVEENSLFLVIWEFIKNNWIPILLVIGSSLITYLIFGLIYRKVKYKF